MTIRVHISVTSMWSSLVFITTFFYFLSELLLPFASTTTGQGSLPGDVTLTFISKGTGALIIFPGLEYCSFPFSLIIGHGDTLIPAMGFFKHASPLSPDPLMNDSMDMV